MAGGRTIGRLASVLAALSALLAVAVAAAPAADGTAPMFAGLSSATTCVPGPVGGDRTTSYRLRWAAARDRVTPARAIVYDVYQATSLRGERFSRPTYTTPAGATWFVTPRLPAAKSYYFVVRARDRAGNRDSNRVERRGVNLCL
jgi:hypothetical protein